MPFEEYKKSPVTGAIGPNSPFGPNQIVNVPGIGPVKLSDYGPAVKGIDIPVTSSKEMRGNAVNRVVTINGQSVRLSGYMPSKYDPYNVDPTGGGNLDAYGHPIHPYQADQAQSQSQLQSQSSGNVTDNPFAGGYPNSMPEPTYNMPPPDLPPITPEEPTMAPYNSAFEGGNAPVNVPTNENVAPFDPQQYYPSSGENIPTSEFNPPFDPQQYYPSEGQNVPTNEGVNLYDPQQYYSDQPANVPTNESMLPVGPNDFLPSEGSNIPTSESMAPVDPQLYSDSTAGANIPTNESMLPTGPEEYLPSSAPETFSYPDGTGGYTNLDSSGNPVPDVAPAQPVFDVQFGGDTGPLYADTTAPGGFGPSTTFGPFNQNPSDIAASAGHPMESLPGSFTNLGRGSGGNIPWFGRYELGRVLSGGRTHGRGPSDALSQFAAHGRRNRGANAMLGAPVVNRNMAPIYGENTQKPGGGAGLSTGGGPGGTA